LKDESDMFAPEPCHLAFISLDQVVVSETHFAIRWDIQPAKNVQQRYGRSRWLSE
jgi:hypothetical protein